MEYTHEKYIEMIDEALKVYLGSVSDGQDVVLDAMKYSAEGGGKRIRPVLTLEFCRVGGGDVLEKFLPAVHHEPVFVHLTGE